MFTRSFSQRTPFLAYLMALGLLLAWMPARASITYYVSNSGSDPNVGTKIALPKKTIQSAITAAVSGDTVIVADDTYTGAGNKDLDFGPNKNITVQSASNNPATCIIDCQNNGRGFYFHNGETSSAVVSGFTITNGFVGDGGGGMSNYLSSPTVTNCIFFRNIGGSSGGMYNGGYDRNNTASPSITNCIFVKNTGDSAGGMFNEFADPVVANCTFVDNKGGMGCGMYNSGSMASVRNCILWDTFGRDMYTEPAGASHGYYPRVSNSDIHGGIPDYGPGSNYSGIDEDPKFVNYYTDNDFYDLSQYDLHLQSDSPCINAGGYYDSSDYPLDLGGNPRIQGGIVDMGAYEYSYPLDFRVTPGGFSYNRTTKRFVQRVTLTNKGAFVTGPIWLVFDGLRSGVTLYHPTGTTSNAPYLQVSSSDLRTGNTIAVILEFVNPLKVPITYSIRVLPGPGNH